MKTKLAILTAALAVAFPSYSQQTVFEYPDGLTVKFNPNATRSGINVGALSGDPSAPNNGDAWYNALTNAFKIRANGQTLTLGEADLSALNASNLTSGTVPDARFPATLPALNGSALTALNAGNLASGTIPDARFPATLPALSGVNLTALNASNLGSGTVPAARFPALTGDVTTSAGAVATTLATVNANVGSFGGSTAIPTFTVNGKGLITAASTAAVIAPAGTLTGTTLAANVTDSSLTSVGTIGTGTWNAGIIAGQYGGTGVNNAGKTLTLGGSYTINGTTGSTLDIGTGGTLGSAAFLTATAGGNLGADSGKVPTYSVDGDLSATTFRARSSLVAGTAGTGDGNVAFYNETNPAGILIVTAPDFTAQHVWTYPGDTSGTHASREWANAAFQTLDADLTTWAGITPGANVGTFLATPTSANLAAALTNETGSTLAVFSDSPTFSTTVNFPAGSASVPGIAFASDADGTGTGIYRSAANETSFAQNGVQKMKIEAGGDVKILNTTGSVNSSTGALVVSGGFAAGGNSTFGGNLNVQTATYSPYFGAISGGIVRLLGSTAGADATRLAFQFTPSSAGASLGISGTTITAQRGDGTAGGTFAASGDLTVGGAATVTGTVTAAGYASSSGILNAQTGTTYTLLASDNGRVIKCTNASAITVTVPAGLPVGFSCQVIQGGAGTVTFSASGTTVNSFGSLLTTAGQYAAASIISDATNTFILSGNLQ